MAAADDIGKGGNGQAGAMGGSEREDSDLIVTFRIVKYIQTSTIYSVGVSIYTGQQILHLAG
ncbi:hypothetical protein, partial [Tolypothrix sp. VBCCA 56010]|uniref:hypothetical protein n=1 Tax=Tolypothrix sp. VBCCA 56010 TaxID=3137731 RepID=UPI003D7E7673